MMELEYLEGLQKKVDNLIQIGTITEVHPENALARVTLLNRVTQFLPVLSTANSFKKHYIPPKVNEQVLVVSPYGNFNHGFILRGIFNKKCKENVEIDTEIIEYSDGTKIRYDSKNSKLELDLKKDISINVNGGLAIKKGESELITTLLKLIETLIEAKTFTMLGPQQFMPDTQIKLLQIKEQLEVFKC